MTIIRAILAALIFTLVPHGERWVAAQRTTVIKSPVACKPCRVRLIPVVALGGNAGVWSPTLSSTVVRAPNGLFLVSEVYDKTSVAVYDQNGSLIRSIGKAGRGPGEMRSATDVDVWGDKFLAVDPRNRRIHFYNTIDGTHLHEIQLQTIPRKVRFVSQDELVFTFGVSATPNSPSLPTGPLYTRVQLSGDTISRFGSRRRINLVGFGKGSGGNAWAWDALHYEISLFDRAGKAIRRLTRANWTPLNPKKKLSSFVADVREIDGLLWVVVHEVDISKSPGAQPQRNGNSVPFTPLEQDKFTDTVIEIIDPVSGRLLTRNRSGRLYMGFADNGHLYRFRELPTGVYVIDIMRVEAPKMLTTTLERTR